MISVVISSARKDLLTAVSNNIAATIGVPFEIITINNSDAAKGICQVYNEGAEQAQYNFLCFMHEDVEMQTPDWGLRVLKAFEQNPDAGVIGIAGSAYKPLSPCGWHGYGAHQHSYFNYIVTYKFSNRQPEHCTHNPGNVLFKEVVCLDGVWLCTTKKVAAENRFDEQLLKGFHGYDVDFCLSVTRQYKAIVVFDILLNHFSEGRFNKDWMDAMLKVQKKWCNRLPVDLTNATQQKKLYRELFTFRQFLTQLSQLKLNKTLALKALLQCGRFWKFDKPLFLQLLFETGKKQLKDKFSPVR